VKKILIGALGIVIGLILGLAYGHMQLASEQKVCQAKLKEMSQRLSQAQRKVAEGRNAEESLEDTNQAMQTQVDALSKEKERLSSENKDLKSKVDASDTKASSLEKQVASLEARASSLDGKSSQLSERLAKVEADKTALDEKQKKTFQTLQEREKELKQLTIDSQAKYDRCAEHNARLCVIAEDLLHKYQTKGVMGSLFEKEPVTQIKKVELEKITQDYKDRIDREKLQAK